MPSITITDGVSINPGFDLRDDAPLASAGFTHLLHATGDFVASLAREVDKVQVKDLSLGAEFTSPNLLSSKLPSLVLDSDVNCAFSILRADDGTLFDDDLFSPKIAIGADEVWVSVELDASVKLAAAASANGLGVKLTGTSATELTTYTRIPRAADGFPKLLDAIATGFNHFDVLTDAQSVRSQPPGTVRVADVSGAVTLGVTAKLPFSLDALASAGLLNTSLSIVPEVTLSAAASVKVEGQLVVRCYRLDASTCQVGIYRKAGKTLTVTLTAGADVGVEVNDDDILGPLLAKALPDVDVAAAGIQGDRAAQLNKVLKTSIDRIAGASCRSEVRP